MYDTTSESVLVQGKDLAGTLFVVGWQRFWRGVDRMDRTKDIPDPLHRNINTCGAMIIIANVLDIILVETDLIQ